MHSLARFTLVVLATSTALCHGVSYVNMTNDTFQEGANAIAPVANISRLNNVGANVSAREATVNGAIFRNWDLDMSSGSGVYTRLYGVQGDGNDSDSYENGYNYDPANSGPFDQKTGGFSPTIRINNLYTMTLGGVAYVPFTIDLNEGNNPNDKWLSLDDFRIYGTNSATEVSVTTTANLSSLGTQLWSLDAGLDRSILMDDTLTAGSGNANLMIYIPASVFQAGVTGGLNPNARLYFYTSYGAVTGLTLSGSATNFSFQGGFEEYAYLANLVPPGSATPVLDAVPEPSAALLVLAGLGTALMRRRRMI